MCLALSRPPFMHSWNSAKTGKGYVQWAANTIPFRSFFVYDTCSKQETEGDASLHSQSTQPGGVS